MTYKCLRSGQDGGSYADRKLLTAVSTSLAGGERIDDVNLHHAAATSGVVGHIPCARMLGPFGVTGMCAGRPRGERRGNGRMAGVQ